jgi:hypothetical protein
MADITFTPTFKHTPWVDNQDRVQAGGTNGFNVRLTAVQTDFGTLSTVVGQVNTALQALGQSPPLTTHQLTLSPALVPVTGSSAWAHDTDGYAVRTGPLTALAGLQTVNVPNGATLVSLRVPGQNSGTGLLTIGLYRSKLLATPAPAERLAQVTGNTNPFDSSSTVDPGVAIVDTATYRYFILANLIGASAADVVSLSGFQVTYQAP